MANEITDPVVSNLVTGLCGLLGGALGAWLGRRTEYEKWLRQERNNAFAQFMQKMKDFQAKALGIIYSNDGEELDRSIRLTELKIDFEVDENLVRLYLPEDERDAFSNDLKDLRNVYDPHIKQTLRIDTCNRVNTSVRKLFERVLHNNG